MSKSTGIWLFAFGILFGGFLGVMANGELYYWAGQKNTEKKAKEEAMRWAKEELKINCLGWYTDRRRNDLMACQKPEWMMDK